MSPGNHSALRKDLAQGLTATEIFCYLCQGGYFLLVLVCSHCVCIYHHTTAHSRYVYNISKLDTDATKVLHTMIHNRKNRGRNKLLERGLCFLVEQNGHYINKVLLIITLMKTLQGIIEFERIAKETIFTKPASLFGLSPIIEWTIHNITIPGRHTT